MQCVHCCRRSRVGGQDGGSVARARAPLRCHVVRAAWQWRHGIVGVCVLGWSMHLARQCMGEPGAQFVCWLALLLASAATGLVLCLLDRESGTAPPCHRSRHARMPKECMAVATGPGSASRAVALDDPLPEWTQLCSFSSRCNTYLS